MSPPRTEFLLYQHEKAAFYQTHPLANGPSFNLALLPRSPKPTAAKALSARTEKSKSMFGIFLNSFCHHI